MAGSPGVGLAPELSGNRSGCHFNWVRLTIIYRNLEYTCKEGGKCIVDVSRRNQCQACRFAKCLEANMRREGKIYTIIIWNSIIFSVSIRLLPESKLILGTDRNRQSPDQTLLPSNQQSKTRIRQTHSNYVTNKTRDILFTLQMTIKCLSKCLVCCRATRCKTKKLWKASESKKKETLTQTFHLQSTYLNTIISSSRPPPRARASRTGATKKRNWWMGCTIFGSVWLQSCNCFCSYVCGLSLNWLLSILRAILSRRRHPSHSQPKTVAHRVCLFRCVIHTIKTRCAFDVCHKRESKLPLIDLWCFVCRPCGFGRAALGRMRAMLFRGDSFDIRTKCEHLRWSSPSWLKARAGLRHWQQSKSKCKSVYRCQDGVALSLHTRRLARRERRGWETTRWVIDTQNQKEWTGCFDWRLNWKPGQKSAA